jgi:hypothetical protein
MELFGCLSFVFFDLVGLMALRTAADAFKVKDFTTDQYMDVLS